MAEKLDTAAAPLKRNLPGTKAADLNRWRLDDKFEDLQSTFPCAEYLQQLIQKDAGNVAEIIKLPPNTDKNVWILEHLRRFLAELHLLMVYLDDECTADTCPKMCATNDWEFLCAAHQEPQKCCAMDYIMHTLVGFISLLSNPNHFPSRTKISSDGAKFFVSMVRRLYRVFAHAYYHHRASFDKFEAKTHLTERFVQLSLRYGLMAEAQLTPPIDLAPQSTTATTNGNGNGNGATSPGAAAAAAAAAAAPSTATVTNGSAAAAAAAPG